jgi:hypothetical protein
VGLGWWWCTSTISRARAHGFALLKNGAVGIVDHHMHAYHIRIVLCLDTDGLPDLNKFSDMSSGS